MVCLTIKEKALGWSRQKRLQGELSGYIFLFLQQASLFFFFLKEVEMLHGCQPWAEASPLLPHSCPICGLGGAGKAAVLSQVRTND